MRALWPAFAPVAAGAAPGGEPHDGGQYLDGLGPLQERLPISGLMWRFLWEIHLTVLRWARWAYAEVEAWPEDLSQLDVIAEFAKVVSAAGSPWADPGT